MQDNRKEFVTFLKTFFGEEITKKLIDLESLSLKKGDAKDLYQINSQIILKQVLKLNPDIHKEIIENNKWAFDFPGWIGELNFDKKYTKEILVIGMEPHIGEKDNNGVKRTAQVTYGLRETDNYLYSELDEYTPNKQLWNNLNGIFGVSEDFKNRDFLEKIYITDLCHFAVKGKVSETYSIKNWPKIRIKNASSYISETIKHIKPKYIISQSSPVSDFVENFMHKTSKLTNEFSSDIFSKELRGKMKNFPNFKKFSYPNNEIIHIRLPHLASGQTNHFWLPKQIEKRNLKLNELKLKLSEFEN